MSIYNLSSPKSKRFFSFIFSILVFFSLSNLFSISTSAAENACDSYSILYEDMKEDIREWSEKAEYYTTFEPSKINLEKIKEDIADDDYILAHCLYSCSWRYQEISNSVYKVNVSYKYYMSESEREKVEDFCERMADELRGKTDYEKIKYVHDYIILHCEYSIINNGPYNCIKKGKACCNGYALAFQMMMDSCGIDCEYVTNSAHAWNTVCLNGVWYNVDCTWDDGEGKNVLYTYFLKSNADFPNHKGANATALWSYSMDEGTSENPRTPFQIWIVSFLYNYWFLLLTVLIAGAFCVAELLLARKKEGKKEE